METCASRLARPHARWSSNGTPLCGKPGCQKPDYHDGPCADEGPRSTRTRKQRSPDESWGQQERKQAKVPAATSQSADPTSAPQEGHLSAGDRVSVLSCTWGGAWARAQHGAGWRAARTYGKVLKRVGSKWQCDFGERAEGMEPASWEEHALQFESRGEAGDSRAEAGVSRGEADDDDQQRDQQRLRQQEQRERKQEQQRLWQRQQRKRKRWRTSGHSFIGRSVRRFFVGLTSYHGASNGRIVSWLPATGGEDALWHMQHADGDV